MKLWEHQELAINMARQSIREGHKRPIIAAPTSFGKTVLAAQMMLNCQKAGKRGWFFCDRINLVNQTIDKFTAFGINFGVRQADHELRNPHAPIQIVSVQTVSAMVKAHNGRLPEFDFALVDECHVQHQIIKDIIENFNNIPVIGLTATPYSKGLGKLYNNLLVPIKPRDLLNQGYLTPIRYYGGEHVDLSRIKSVNQNTYSPKDLESATDDMKEILTGSLIRNWLEWGERSQTIAFSPSKAHSRYLVQKFNDNGVSAEHIDCDTPTEEREDMYKAHNDGEFKILSCSRLLNTGYDSPSTRCIIDCFPTKSVTVYAQRMGRIKRLFENKEYGIYLGHAGNYERHGDPFDIYPTELHDGEKPHNEKELTSKKETKEGKSRDCPQCYQQFNGMRCACGYEIPITEQMEDDGTMLKELEQGKAANKKTSTEDKSRFLSDLIFYGNQKKMKNANGWASHQYKSKFGVWPNKIKPYAVTEIGAFTKKEFARQAIARKATA